MKDPKKEPPMRRCFCCGAELGRHWYSEPLDNCGKPECVQEAREIEAEERWTAHQQLDRDRGWD